MSATTEPLGSARRDAGTARARGRSTLRRGHWAADRWIAGGEYRTPELFVAGERIADGATAVATTIIHEAVHALLHARGDTTGGTSRQGPYLYPAYPLRRQPAMITTTTLPEVGAIVRRSDRSHLSLYRVVGHGCVRPGECRNGAQAVTVAPEVGEHMADPRWQFPVCVSADTLTVTPT